MFFSIAIPTYGDYIIYELNYGNDDLKSYKKFPNTKETKFFQIEMSNHAEGMNFLFGRRY